VSATSPSWLTLAAVCDELSVSKSTFNAWRRDGRFPQGKRLPNGSLRFKATEVAVFIDSLAAA
jgi:predicted DNA-binding transcriptional regulator AlpA